MGAYGSRRDGVQGQLALHSGSLVKKQKEERVEEEMDRDVRRERGEKRREKERRRDKRGGEKRRGGDRRRQLSRASYFLLSRQLSLCYYFCHCGAHSRPTGLQAPR